MNTIDGIIEDLELEDSCVGGCTTKGEIIECLENLKILQKEKESVLKALEDVRAEIGKSIKESVEKTSFNGSVFRCGLHEAVEIIDRKIAEVTHDNK